MNPPAPRPVRRRRITLALLTASLALAAWLGYREYDYRAAIRELEAGANQLPLPFPKSSGRAIPSLSFTWEGPVERIQKDWRVAFSKAAWAPGERRLSIRSPEALRYAVEHDLF